MNMPRENLALPRNLLAHGIVMLLLVLLVNFAQMLLGFCAVLQFFWMLVARERNAMLAGFGLGLANWLAMTSRFLTGASDLRPFPWTRWN